MGRHALGKVTSTYRRDWTFVDAPTVETEEDCYVRTSSKTWVRIDKDKYVTREVLTEDKAEELDNIAYTLKVNN